MGYEAIARRRKVAIFTPKNFIIKIIIFGWPAKYNRKFDFFNTNNITYNEVERVLNNIYLCSQNKWENNYYNIIKSLLNFDYNNNKLKKTILDLKN